jgi:hypothetical protein
MFFREPSAGYTAPAVARPLAAALTLTVLATFYLGVIPDRVLKTLENARDRIVGRFP